MRSSAIILAGGFSKRFERNKGLVELKGKPLVMYILEKVSRVVDDKVIVVGSRAQRVAFSPLTKRGLRVVVDRYDGNSPLIGALTGFETVLSEYSLLLPCDTPFVSKEVAGLLLDCCIGKSAVVPRWPNGWIEPLQAAYNVKSARAAARKALNQGEMDMLSMISYLSDVRYVSTKTLREFDRELLTFFNINTLIDLKKAESLLSQAKQPTNSGLPTS